MMVKLTPAQIKAIKRLLARSAIKQPAEELSLIANILSPLTPQTCDDIDLDSAGYIQKLLFKLAMDPGHFAAATDLLGKIYLGETLDDEESVENCFKRLFTAASDTIELETKKTVFAKLIRSQYVGAVDLAFSILDLLVEDEDNKTYTKDFLNIVLQAMSYPEKHANLLHRVRNQLHFMLAELKMPCDETLGAILIQLAQSEEILLFLGSIEAEHRLFAEIFLTRDVHNQTLTWTATAMGIVAGGLSTLSNPNVVVFLNKMAAFLEAQRLTMVEQKQLFTALKGMHQSVDDWVDFNLENVSPPVSPNSYMSTSPLTRRWKDAQHKPVNTLFYKASYSAESLEFKEAEGSHRAFCPFAVLDTSRQSVMSEISRLSAILMSKSELESLIKAQINMLLEHMPAEQSLAHPKDIKKLAGFNEVLQSISAIYEKVAIYTSYANTVTELDQKIKTAAFIQYAQLTGVKICFWQESGAGKNELILHAHSHDDLLDPSTKHFIFKNNYINLIYRIDIKQHLEMVRRVSLRN